MVAHATDTAGTPIEHAAPVSQVPTSAPSDAERQFERISQGSVQQPTPQPPGTVSPGGDPCLDPRPLASQPALAADDAASSGTNTASGAQSASTQASSKPPGGGGEVASSTFSVQPAPRSASHERIPSTGSDMPVAGALPLASGREGSMLSSASSLAESLGSPPSVQAANSTEEVFSQISQRMSAQFTHAPTPPSPLPLVAERVLPPPEQLHRQCSGTSQPQQPQQREAEARPQELPAAQTPSPLSEWGWDQQPAKMQPSAAAPPLQRKKPADSIAAEAFAALGVATDSSAAARQRQTSDEHRRGEVAQLSSYGWLSTGGNDAAQTPSEAAEADAAVQDQCQAGGGGHMARRHSAVTAGGSGSDGDDGGPEVNPLHLALLKRQSTDGSDGGMQLLSRDSNRCGNQIYCAELCTFPAAWSLACLVHEPVALLAKPVRRSCKHTAHWAIEVVQHICGSRRGVVCAGLTSAAAVYAGASGRCRQRQKRRGTRTRRRGCRLAWRSGSRRTRLRAAPPPRFALGPLL